MTRIYIVYILYIIYCIYYSGADACEQEECVVGEAIRVDDDEAIVEYGLDEPGKGQANEQIEHIGADYVWDAHVDHALFDHYNTCVGVGHTRPYRHKCNGHERVRYAECKAYNGDL